MDYRVVLSKLVNGEKLSEEDSMSIALSIMDGEIPDIIVSALLVALRIRGESVDEIVGFAKAMRMKSLKIPCSYAIDVVGTGGDGIGTLNVSTASAILTSIVYPVAKHGNRAVSGRSGSADLLEFLGYRIEIEPDRAIELISKTGFVFLFAPLYHPAMKRVASIRKMLGIRTIFNVLGPLTNPGGTKKQVIGVFSKSFAHVIAEAAARLDFEKVLVIHGEPGIDEVSPSGLTHVYEVKGSRIEYYTLQPEDFGVKNIPITRLTVSGVEDSATRILRAAKGLDRDAKVFIGMNTALALYVADIVKDFKDGFEYAENLLLKLIDRIETLLQVNGDIDRFRSLLVKIL
ncbi:MAG: anthranilate phosphoribosyltransferase [Ignisphaera sp.]